MNIYEVLKKYFGYDSFRRGQLELINGILNGSDVIGIMPTGGGKSICYQLPSVILEGITIVISPLISLMKDQVDSLNETGISSTFINSTLSYDELKNILNDIKEGKHKIIYVAPERLNTGLFINLIKDIKVSMVAVDEAHCISQWGHDFRPSYLDIPKFIDSLEVRPMVAAFTATATKKVTKEIINLIGLKNPNEIITGFNRPNLFYQVVKISDKFNYLTNYLDNNFTNNSGIIYCSTRKTVESLVKKLRDKGVSVAGYHGGMDAEDRKENQEDFIFNRARIIIATNAFGMGIDKPDVRFVIHYNMPKNMEAYYQEAGRAGRDGEKSDCILMYSPSDIVKQKLIIQSENLTEDRQRRLYTNLQYLVDYCHTNDCLRNNTLSYFGEEIIDSKCDNCGNCLDESEMIDITVETQKILSCVYRVNERYGSNVIIQTLKGSKNKKILGLGLDKISTYGIMEGYKEAVIREMIMTLVSRGYLYLEADKFPVLRLTNKSREILKGEVKIYHKKNLVENLSKSKSQEKPSIDIDNNVDEDLFNDLRELRFEKAQEKSVPAYVIFHDATLKEMAVYYPQNKSEMLEIKGIGVRKYENYGEEFIQLIKDYCEGNKINIEEIRKEIEVSIDNVEEKNNRTKMSDGESKDKGSSHEITYNYYIRGLSLEEIANERNLTQRTILNHLIRCEKEEKEVKWDKFTNDLQKEEEVIKAIKQVGTEKLRPIKEIVSSDISYIDIQLVLLKNGIR